MRSPGAPRTSRVDKGVGFQPDLPVVVNVVQWPWKGFPIVFSMVFQLLFESLSMAVQLFFNGFSMACQWLFNGCSMVVQWFVNGFSMVFQLFFNGCSMVFQWFSIVFQSISMVFNGFQWFSVFFIGF